MDITVKKASIEDLRAIQELNNELFKLEYNNYDPSLKVGWAFEKEGTDYFTKMITDEVVFVGKDSNKVIGYLAGSIHVEGSYVIKTLAEIENLYVAEEYRRSGLGARLINEFKKYCMDFRIEEIKVTASAKNSNAIKFYKKNGFEDFECTFKIKLD